MNASSIPHAPSTSVSSSPGFPGSSRLSGRVAVVTGSGHGLGKAYAQRLAAEGAAVVVADFDETAGAQVFDELERDGYESLFVPTDVGDQESVQRMVAASVERFGKVDILINNAAIFASVGMDRGRPEDISMSDFERVLKVNVLGTWMCCTAVASVMRAREYGKIVNISSTTIFGVKTDAPHYVVSKSAVVGVTRTLARAWGPDGIRVNSVSPGFVETEVTKVNEAQARARGAAPLARALARPQTPEDMVGAVAFLAAPDSDFITGQNLVVDGGDILQ
jgi:3-oxoacyl-[acyl-carrier protein] reductase